jgi:hypothetical protein
MRHPSFVSLLGVCAAALALGSTSCGSSSSGGATGTNEDTGNGGDDTGGTVTDGTPVEDTEPGDDTGGLGEYPPGPYGTKTGDILADFEMSGYLNLDSSQVSTTAEYKTVKLSDVRAAAKVPYLFIHEVGFF